jgi:hypothetical protein
MFVVPATLVLGLGLGILIGSQLNTTGGHSAAWRTGWQWAQQHWSAYLADNNDLSLSSAAQWCNSAHDRTVLRRLSAPAGVTPTYVGQEVAPSWDWQQGCIARIRSADG